MLHKVGKREQASPQPLSISSPVVLTASPSTERAISTLTPETTLAVSNQGEPQLTQTPLVPGTGSGKTFEPRVNLELVGSGFSAPLGLVSPPDGTGRLFVFDQVGLIYLLSSNPDDQPSPFLDLRDRMVSLRQGYDERGLLGLAFHPRFSENGRFFVYYSAPLQTSGSSGWDHTSQKIRVQHLSQQPRPGGPWQ